MKKIISLIALFTIVCFPIGVLADNNIGAWVKVHSDTWTTANSLATNVATLTYSSGIDLPPGGAVTVVTCAESTRTISGGNLRAYVMMPVAETATDGGTNINGGVIGNPVAFEWFAYPALDFALGTGVHCSASGDKQVLSGVGRILWIPDTVTVSGGTTVVTTLSRRKGLSTNLGN